MGKLREKVATLIAADAIKDAKDSLVNQVMLDIKAQAIAEASEYSEAINKRKGQIAGNDALLASVAGGVGAISAKIATNAAGNAIGTQLPAEAENLLSAAVGLLIVKLVAGIRKRIQNRRKFGE